MRWVLYLWLAYSPDTMTPLARFDTSTECHRAKAIDIAANIRAGLGGGATYDCLEDKNASR